MVLATKNEDLKGIPKSITVQTHPFLSFSSNLNGFSFLYMNINHIADFGFYGNKGTPRNED